MNKILVTGSEGNIGTYLVEYLQKAKPDASIIRADFGQVEDRHKKQQGHFYGGDLTDSSFVKSIFQENKIDDVIHLAAKNYSAGSFKENAYGVFSNDQKILLNVLDNSKSIKKFIYLSSAIVYESSEKTPFTEELTEEILPPKSSLGLTKYLGEAAVKFFGEQYGVPYTIWRPFNVVSPKESHEGQSGHVFVDFYRKIFVKQAPKIEIYGNGKQVRCFTWVQDVVKPVVDFLTDEKTDDQVFNIGSNEPKTLIELKDFFIKIGKEKGILPAGYSPEIIFGGNSPMMNIQQRIPSTEKLQRVLGFACQTSFEECFEKFIEYKQKISN